MSGENKRSLDLQGIERCLKRVKTVLSSSSGNPGPSTQSAHQVNISCMPGTGQQPTPERFKPSSLAAAPPTVEPDNNTSIPPASNIPTPQTSKQDPKRERWADFKDFAKKLLKGFNSFGPLKEAVDIIVEGIEIFETANQNRADYEKLRKDLNGLFHDLAEFFDASTPPTMAPTIINFAKGIDQELESIRLKLSETSIGTHQTDADKILEHNRRIQALIQRLTSNVGIKTLRVAEEQATESRLKSLPHSPAAKYDSGESSDLRGRCTQDTRVDLLEDIYEWACNENSPKIYWLNGMAGTGKTTIAYSFCERLERFKKLAASFFCSRQLPSCRDVNRIVPTMSYQLSRFSRPFRSALSPVLENDPDVHNQVLLRQFKRLILEPLGHINIALRTDLVIVIDALDECDNNDGVDRMLNALLSHAQELPIKFFVASRPDAKILDRMRGQHGDRAPTELRLHELGRPTVQEDIKTYLNAQLKPHMSLSAANLNILVERSGVLFIYASTVVRYLACDNFSRAEDRLEDILEVCEDSSNDSEKGINDLYTVILEAAFTNPTITSRDKAEMKLVLDTVICAQEPLSIDDMASLLGLSTRKVRAALRPLFSVLHLSDMTAHTITTLHESFPDYLLDKRRSRVFYCDASKRHTHLARLCFKHIKLQNPSFNICNLESSYVFDKDVPDLPTRVKKAISSQLLYACRYWVAHYMSAEGSQDLVSMLREFASERFMLWMEVMNLSGNIHRGVRTLDEAQTLTLDIVQPSDGIRKLLLHMSKFAHSFASTAARLSTPHIYVSTLSFWPDNSPISEYYRQPRTRLITGRRTAMSQRNSTPVATMDVHAGVFCASYSPDGTYIVSGSFGGTMHIWNAHTGQLIGQPLREHSSAVGSVAYSPDGAYLVSGSWDNTIRIWDAYTGQSVGQPLQGHTSHVRSVGYSQDGASIISSSRDNTIRIWDAYTGQQRGQPLKGHTSEVSSVAYSSDGAYIVSGSYDKTVRIWDVHTCQPVGQPFVGHTWFVTSVAYSPDGEYIISGSWDCTIRIWDARARQSLGRPLSGHTSYVLSVACSPDSAYIASGSSDETIRIWDARTGQPLGRPMQGHTGAVNSVAYSPDGAYVISGSDDTTIRVWNVRLVFKPMDDILPINSGQSQLVHSLSVIPEPHILCNLGCQLNCPHMAWTLNDDGWIVFNGNKLLLVPPDLRTTLLRPQNTALMSTRGFLHLNLDRDKLGKHWQEYFRP